MKYLTIIFSTSIIAISSILISLLIISKDNVNDLAIGICFTLSIIYIIVIVIISIILTLKCDKKDKIKSYQ